MEGVPEDIMTGWRNQATQFLARSSIKTLDPCRRKKFHEGEMTPNLVKRIVKMDLQDISNSTVLLINLTKAAGANRCWGSIAEMAHAHTKNKIIITIMDKGDRHPFVEFYSTEIHYSLETALEAITFYYG
jgi:hypothetical protein